MALERLSAAAARAVDEYYERCRGAEQHRAEEVHAAVVVQSCWRGRLQRQELQKLSHIALTIQRCWRGYLGRQCFAAALLARNTQLRKAYFCHQATVIQKWWRGYFSRSRVHDFYKRKSYLAAVAAANADVRAGMAAELQEALQHQQHQVQQTAKQHFDAQVSRLHHLASTGCRAGIFNPPPTAAGATREPPAVAGQPLEQHLRAAAKQQAAGVVTQQQEAMRQAIRSSATSSTAALNFPAGSTAARAASGAATASSSAGPAATDAPAAVRPVSGVSVPASTVCAHSSGSATGALKGVPAAGKLSGAVVASVDEWYAARADPNMPDGSFNPSLTLQQSADYEAARRAAGLERRISRGLMLVLHNQSFNNITKPASGIQRGSPSTAAAPASAGSSSELEHCSSPGYSIGAAWDTERLSSGRLSMPQQQAAARTAGHPHWQQQQQQQQWQHNKHTGTFFSKHLKQPY